MNPEVQRQAMFPDWKAGAMRYHLMLICLAHDGIGPRRRRAICIDNS
jgi:hypothetical protein